MSVMTDLTKDLSKNIEDLTSKIDATRPLYAAVGVTDLYVEKARETAARVEEFGVAVRAEFDKLVADLQPEKVEARAEAAFGQVKGAAVDAPKKARVQGKANLEAAAKTYDELAVRGEKLVKRIRNQQATKDLVAQAETTVAQAKGAVTTAKKAVDTVERSAKATVTTGRKEAVKAARAIAESVTDEVKTAEAEVAGAVKRTRTAAKRTNTTARNAAKKTVSSAKATRTSAKKTAAATTKAAEKAAEKVGD